MIDDFLDGDRNYRTREATIGLVVEEAKKRPSFDLSALKKRLDGSRISIISKCAFVERKIVPEIRKGDYDIKPKERRLPLSSQNMFKKLKDLGVEDDSEDGFGYERVDYYLNAVWADTEITIEEIHKFSEGMIVWIEAKKEWRTATKVLKLCGMSKTLGAHMAPDEAMERVEREVAECKQLDEDLDGIMEGI